MSIRHIWRFTSAGAFNGTFTEDDQNPATREAGKAYVIVTPERYASDPKALTVTPQEISAALTANTVALATASVSAMSATMQASTARLISPSVEFLADEGPVTLDGDGHKWIMQPDGLGSLMAVQISASPEVSKEVRQARIATKRADLKAVYDQVNADANPSRDKKIDLLWQELQARAKAAQ